MPESGLGQFLALTGAALTVGSSTVAGLRIHKAVVRHAPRLAAFVPRDAGVIGGLLAGAAIVGLWLRY